MDFDRKLTTLLDMYSFAHYWAPYNVAHARRLIDEPMLPAPYLEDTAWRYDIEDARILGALESIPHRDSPATAPETKLSANDFRLKAKLFRQVAPIHGIKLKMTSANDL